jgi:hypothetical protein
MSIGEGLWHDSIGVLYDQPQPFSISRRLAAAEQNRRSKLSTHRKLADPVGLSMSKIPWQEEVPWLH